MRGDGRMKHLRQALLPLPVPASIYGLVLLFAALELGIIKLSAVEDAGKFLIEIMPVMFIPAGAGLVESWSALKPICVQVVVIMFVSTIVVMVISGRVTQFVIRRNRKALNNEGIFKSVCIFRCGNQRIDL